MAASGSSSAEREGQTERDGRRYATGIRSVVAMTWNREVGALYALQHGRDDLYRSWSAFIPSGRARSCPPRSSSRSGTAWTAGGLTTTTTGCRGRSF